MSKAVVGLGNPGSAYSGTRDSAGWMLIDHLARRAGMPAWRRGDQAMQCSGTIGGTPVRLLKPTTYMNLSGRALGALRSPGWNPATDLLVLVDEAYVDFGGQSAIELVQRYPNVSVIDVDAVLTQVRNTADQVST
ncbi:MAG TPA: hypothetical protein PLL69_10900, partial [Gemmatimonadales bacterium]|nr:hypothetical protein [Gemmatimonadales bacterium]